jgi:hypothetical protein
MNRLKEIKKNFKPAYYYMGYNLNYRDIEWMMQVLERLEEVTNSDIGCPMKIECPGIRCGECIKKYTWEGE